MKFAIQCLAVCLLVSSAMPGAIAAPAPSTSDVLSRWDRDEHPDLRGVIVLRDGRTIAERYYNGATANELRDIRSAGKSVTALLVGIAVDRGAIRSVDDPVSRYWGSVPVEGGMTP